MENRGRSCGFVKAAPRALHCMNIEGVVTFRLARI
jgi:hypothetical protein